MWGGTCCTDKYVSTNGSASLLALCYVHHLSLKAAVIRAQHPSRRIQHRNRIVQTAGMLGIDWIDDIEIQSILHQVSSVYQGL